MTLKVKSEDELDPEEERTRPLELTSCPPPGNESDSSIPTAKQSRTNPQLALKTSTYGGMHLRTLHSEQ